MLRGPLAYFALAAHGLIPFPAAASSGRVMVSFTVTSSRGKAEFFDGERPVLAEIGLDGSVGIEVSLSE